MGSYLKPSFSRTMASLALGVAGVLALSGAAWAGADDGGTKAFYAAPGPGLYVQGPAPGAAAEPAQSDNPSIGGTPATATMENGAYQGYRDQPEAVRPQKRHKHHINQE